MENVLYNISERSNISKKYTSDDIIIEIQIPPIDYKIQEFNALNDDIEEILWNNTVKELTVILRNSGISIPRGSKKAELINLIFINGLFN